MKYLMALATLVIGLTLIGTVISLNQPAYSIDFRQISQSPYECSTDSTCTTEADCVDAAILTNNTDGDPFVNSVDKCRCHFGNTEGGCVYIPPECTDNCPTPTPTPIPPETAATPDPNLGGCQVATNYMYNVPQNTALKAYAEPDENSIYRAPLTYTTAAQLLEISADGEWYKVGFNWVDAAGRSNWIEGWIRNTDLAAGQQIHRLRYLVSDLCPNPPTPQENFCTNLEAAKGRDQATYQHLCNASGVRAVFIMTEEQQPYGDIWVLEDEDLSQITSSPNQQKFCPVLSPDLDKIAYLQPDELVIRDIQDGDEIREAIPSLWKNCASWKDNNNLYIIVNDRVQLFDVAGKFYVVYGNFYGDFFASRQQYYVNLDNNIITAGIGTNSGTQVRTPRDCALKPPVISPENSQVIYFGCGNSLYRFDTSDDSLSSIPLSGINQIYHLNSDLGNGYLTYDDGSQVYLAQVNDATQSLAWNKPPIILNLMPPNKTGRVTAFSPVPISIQP